MDILFWLIVMFAILPLWGLVCNERTSRARLRMVDHVFRQSNWGELNTLFKATSYEKHVLALMLFRDPWKQYDPKLLEGFKR